MKEMSRFQMAYERKGKVGKVRRSFLAFEGKGSKALAPVEGQSVGAAGNKKKLTCISLEFSSEFFFVARQHHHNRRPSNGENVYHDTMDPNM